MVVLGDDPRLSLDKPKFDMAIEYIAAIFSSISFLLSLGNVIYNVRNALMKPTPFLRMIAAYSILICFALLMQIVCAYFAINWLSKFFYIFPFGLSSYAFALTQAQTTRLVIPSSATADKYIFRLNVAHTLAHLLFAPPMYLIPLINSFHDYGGEVGFLERWFSFTVLWWAYVSIYDCSQSSWVAYKMYQYGKTLLSSGISSDGTGTAGSASHSHLPSSRGNLASSVGSIPLNEVGPKSPSLPRRPLLPSRASKERAMRKQFVTTITWLFVSLIIDLMSIMWLVIFFMTAAPSGTQQSRFSNACGQLASANGGFHSVAATIYFQNIIALYQAKNARGSQKTKSKDNLSTNNLASPPMSPPPVHSS
ncbi:hypothetical protein BC831DRAFT_453225 [Entophlyctis helioformis]|nr:hypothetical protein BC831DRAFT_453225 [Entophlyctis helioformis]